jgi:hypothetical protein
MPPSSSIPPDATIIPVPNNLALSTSPEVQFLPHPTQRALLLHLQSEPEYVEPRRTLRDSLQILSSASACS